jgi:hypothetical protein
VDDGAGVNSNLVQYLLKLIFRKEQKRYNGKYKHYTEIFHLETQTGKTSIYYIDTLVLHCLQYKKWILILMPTVSLQKTAAYLRTHKCLQLKVELLVTKLHCSS